MRGQRVSKPVLRCGAGSARQLKLMGVERTGLELVASKGQTQGQAVGRGEMGLDPFRPFTILRAVHRGYLCAGIE